jgi:uncharacterized LabA/DUF88 family protein
MSTRSAFAHPIEDSHKTGTQKLSYGQQSQIIGRNSQALILILRYMVPLLAPANCDDRGCPSPSSNLVQRYQTMCSDSQIALFIDGANLYTTAKVLGFDIDYRRLLKEFQSRGVLLRAYYYTAVIEDQEYTSIRPLIDWLDYNGFTLVTKATKEFIDGDGRRKIKGNMDIELAVDAMELAAHMDQMVLFSGDGNLSSLVGAVQRRGVRVTVVSTISSRPPMIADELRRQADVFTDLIELQPLIAREITN